MSENPSVSARDIAAALELPPPTDQQIAVIEAPLEPALVVAGAGSGKTETMANRVLWLLANGHVRPGEVLGLTFTRKAAGELAARIRTRIEQLAAVGLVPGDHDPFEAPDVATYNSFANAIFRDNAVLVGRDGDGPVLGEAGAWQLVRRVVTRSADPRLPDLDKNLDPVTSAVLNLSRAMAENLADPEEVRALSRDIAALADLPYGDRFPRDADLAFTSQVAALDVLVDLVAEYEEAKFARSAVEYSDQVALALRIVRKAPRVREELRARAKVVLLDEYQDTSVVQTWLLAELFADHPVMAVGDPNQSIYGWRGASASNLEQFAGQFGASGPTYALSTSWRNGHRILDAANALVAPLAAASRVPVAELTPSPVASDHAVRLAFDEDIETEAATVADWFAARVGTAERPVASPPSAALLFRARATQAVFLAALRERGVPYHVLGIGGLMAEPEIADLVAMLAVLDDAGAGLELIRVLAGSRWRIGVQDLHALNRLASWLRDRDHAQRPYDEELQEKLRASLTEGESGSIVDALDFIAGAPEGHGALARFTEAGLLRLRDAGATVRRLRGRIGMPLPDLVTLVEQELRLDVEAIANETRRVDGAAMEAFLDAIDGYLALEVGGESASLRGFLAWLRAAEDREDLAPRPEDPEPGTVQILTIHGSKGLEWDLVAVPRLVQDELPMKPVDGTNGWLAFGQLPWPFRGDRDDLPDFAWRGAATRKEVAAARKDFKAAVAQRVDDEERRLAYVAVTRARHELLLSGSFWSTPQKPRRASAFVADIAAAGVVPAPPDAPTSDENPLGDDLETFRWPRDPLGHRRAAVERAAEAVRAATPGIAGRLAEELTLLLAERAARAAGEGRVTLPVRVAASRFKDFVSEPGAVASSTLRPMPERPYRATRLGTLFHAWVEERYGIGAGADELDAAPDELDDLGDDAAGLGGFGGSAIGVEPEAEELSRLQATFAASPWADRRPVEVEREIHLPFDDRIVICKIDAVYRDDLEPERFEIVDWKTGKAPKDADDLERKQLQLALYRLAYSRWAGVPVDRIDAAFYFVADDRIIRPDHLDSEEELLARWRAAFGVGGAS
ncbi:UvrD-helicase domain-containing protein [Pseudolysinimonas sp.]|uniref:UvrD-helicase domain-containing protein n=1 Tax=Pseudolysinimonas sp. TaxID=2680009 RepID=UPI003F81CFDD